MSVATPRRAIGGRYVLNRPILRVSRALARRKIETLSLAAVAAISAVGIVLGSTGNAIGAPVVAAAHATRPTPIKRGVKPAPAKRGANVVAATRSLTVASV